MLGDWNGFGFGSETCLDFLVSLHQERRARRMGGQKREAV